MAAKLAKDNPKYDAFAAKMAYRPIVKFTERQRERLNTTGCVRCAVVGSAGSLLRGPPRGAEIDAHDCVVRVNYPPVPSRLHARVGSRTDFQFVREPVPLSLQQRPERAVHATRNIVYWYWQHANPAYLALTRQNMTKLQLLHPHVKEYATKWKRKVGEAKCGPEAHMYNPSTGLIALVFASAFCHSTTVYGFDDLSWPYHYYTIEDALAWFQWDPRLGRKWKTTDRLQHPCLTKHGITMDKLKANHERLQANASAVLRRSHDWPLERAVLRELARQGLITLNIPSPEEELEDEVLERHRAELACAPEAVRRRAQELGVAGETQAAAQTASTLSEATATEGRAPDAPAGAAAAASSSSNISSGNTSSSSGGAAILPAELRYLRPTLDLVIATLDRDSPCAPS